MILAEAVRAKKEAENTGSSGGTETGKKAMVSPYMNHHYVEALLMCGKKTRQWNI